MNFDDLPLDLFEVDCDGSACASPTNTNHTHPRQDGLKPLARVIVRDNKRIGYELLEQA